MINDHDKPSARRRGRAGIFVVAVILAVIVLVFAGRNIWHAEKLDQEQETAVKEHNGLS